MFGRPTGTATTTVGGDRDAMRCWWLCRRAGVRGGALDDWLAGGKSKKYHFNLV